MTLGINIKNDNNELQIDAAYRNLSLETFTRDTALTPSAVTGDPDGGTTGGQGLSITANILPPFFAMQPPDDCFMTFSIIEKTGEDYDIVYIWFERKSTSVTWKVYRESYDLGSQDYGMRVFNSKNELCFDNNNRTLKLHSIHDVSLSYPTTAASTTFPSTVITHSDIENPFYLLIPKGTNQFGYYYVANGSPDYDYTLTYIYNFVGVKKVSSTSVRVGWFRGALWWFNNFGYPISSIINYGDATDMMLLVFYS